MPYCDHNATAPLRPEAREAVERALSLTGNPSSVHAGGRAARAMAEAARETLEVEQLNVVADAGYSNGAQAARLEAAGIVPHVPANRAVNNQGDGTLFDRSLFVYDEKSDSFRCPAGKTVARKQLHRADRTVLYQARADDCGACSMKPRCTRSPQRMLSRHLDDDALNRMHARATPALMRLRRSCVEHPFAHLKHRVFGHPRLLLRGLSGARTEIALGIMAYNLKRIVNILSAARLTQALTSA